jgi:hypothetical protein
LPITDTPTLTATATETLKPPTNTPTLTATPFRTLFYFKPTLNPSYTGDLCNTGWLRIKGLTTSTRNDYSYLTLNTNQSASAEYTAVYSIKIDKYGYYQISNWVADHNPAEWSCPKKTIDWDSSRTPFRINHANGEIVVYIDQHNLYDEWAVVGKYYFNAGTIYKIIIFDLNNEADLSQTISVGTLRVEYIP